MWITVDSIDFRRHMQQNCHTHDNQLNAFGRQLKWFRFVVNSLIFIIFFFLLFVLLCFILLCFDILNRFSLYVRLTFTIQSVRWYVLFVLIMKFIHDMLVMLNFLTAFSSFNAKKNKWTHSVFNEMTRNCYNT